MKWLIVAFLIIIPLSIDAYTVDDIVQAVIQSLKEEPDHWFHDEYRLYYFKDKEKGLNTDPSNHDSEADCVIWVANEAYGINITSPKKVVIENKKDKQFIWDTYQKWAVGHFAEKVFNMKKPPEQLKDELPEDYDPVDDPIKETKEVAGSNEL